MNIHDVLRDLRHAEDVLMSGSYHRYSDEVSFWVGYLTAVVDYDQEPGEMDIKKAGYLVDKLKEEGVLS